MEQEKKKIADPEALPSWWLASVAVALVACVVMFTMALLLDSVILAFVAILVLLIAATVLPIMLRRSQRNQEATRP